MTIRRLVFVTSLVLAFLLPSAALGQSCGLRPCSTRDTLKQCFERLTTSGVEIAFEQDRKSFAQETILQGLTASTTPATNPKAGGTVQDLLPSFLTSLGIDGLDFDEGNLTFDKVFDLEEEGWKVTVGATAFASSGIYDPLEDALKESLAVDELSTVTASLEEQVEDFDKVDYKAVIAKQRGGNGLLDRWGRDPHLYSDLLKFWEEDLDDFLKARGKFLTAESQQLEVLGVVVEQEEIYLSPKTYSEFNQLQAADVTRAEKEEVFQKRLSEFTEEEQCAVVGGLRQVLAIEVAKEPPLTEKQRIQLQSLIGNQPQAFVEWVREERSSEVLGPTSTNVRASYEMGISGNINDFLEWAKDKANSSSPDGCIREEPNGESYLLPNLKCLKLYLRDETKKPESQHRVAFALSYESQDAFEFDLTDEAFDFALPEVDKTVASLAYGRYFPDFSLFDKGEQGTRADLEVKYEDPSEEDGSTAENAMTLEAKERFVATLTFSQKLADQTDLSISLVYANEPEFLGMVDEEVTANFGIKWSAKPKAEKEKKKE